MKKRILNGLLVMAGGIIFTILAAPLLNFLFSLTQGSLWNQYDRVGFEIYIFVSPIIYLAGVVFAAFRRE